MPTERPRITGIPDTDALTVLGYSVDEDGQSLCVTGPAKRLAKLVERAARDIPLSRAEWNAVADVMNGCADLYDYAESDVPALLMVTANLQDAIGIEEKWKVDVKAICRKLNRLTPTHGEAILAAIRWAWRHCDAWDHSKDEWWTAAFRRASAKD